ncbi:MAG: hypothetical protein AUK54_08605 [Helicobacteraceae bacterium CG2_30_36_10]|nr:MAG: hypothetical protein AUK54_08605 [Helicobacteraceae bacterium CG2_30_36_10]
MQNIDIPLHDIKSIVAIEEHSLYYFLGLVSLALLLACGIIYLLYVWFKRRKAFNIRKEHMKLLNAVDLSETKKAAYAITAYGSTFSEDSPRHVEMFKNLTSRLEAYKYKKSVDAFDDETIGYIELYRGMIDV